jgi:type I restriction enzyme, S subunit
MRAATQKIPKGYKQSDIGIIPDDWEATAAARLCKLVVDCKNRTPPVIDGDEFAVVRTPNVRNGKFIREDLRFTDECSFHAWTVRATPQVGDILITREAPLGEVCLVPTDLRVCLGQRMMLYRPDHEVADSRYLLYALMSSGVQRDLLKKIGGSTVGHARVDDIRNLHVPMPPTRAEQDAVATALSDTDALIENLEKLIEKKKNIKQGAMQELLTGKRRLPGFSDEWKTKKLGNVAEFLRGRDLPKSAIAEGGAHKCIHYGQLFTEYHELVGEVRSKTNMNAGCFYSKANDVLMPTSDVTPRGLATASCIRESGVILGGGILVIRFQSGYDGLYFSYHISQNKASILKLVKGSTVFHLYASDLSNLEIGFPGSKEQEQIAIILSGMDTEIRVLEQQLDKYRNIKQGMMQVLLTGTIRLAAA